MTCFVAQMEKKGYFRELHIDVTKKNAKEIEKEIARTVGLQGEHCPAIWRETKNWLSDPKKKAILDMNLKRKFAGKVR